MAKVIMVQGTTSDAGKTFIAAGLCRIFSQDGYKVAPFKSQNMAFPVTLESGYEIGSAQVMQAEAANCKPDPRMNPILLKPKCNVGSEVIVNGISKGYISGIEYSNYKLSLKEDIKEAFNSLSNDYDIIVIEGAGSPAEINLNENDIVNMGMARIADSPVVIVGDIDRGGVFAAFAGTVSLIDEEDRSRVKGLIVNKFRGDIKLLENGLDMIEDITKVPVLGVVPKIDIDLDDEDSLTGNNINKYEGIENVENYKNSQYDKLSATLRQSLDIKEIYKIMGL